MHEWILDVWEYFETGQDSLEGSITPTALPGWWYTRALAMKIREDTARSQASEIMSLRANSLKSWGFQDHALSIQAFVAAVSRFPSLLPLLADKVDVALSVEERSKPAFRVHVDSS